jgi:hypothetical protein
LGANGARPLLMLGNGTADFTFMAGKCPSES